jgi:hypothetical protein
MRLYRKYETCAGIESNCNYNNAHFAFLNFILHGELNFQKEKKN